MKKVNIIIWLIILFAVGYIIVNSISSFDVKNIEPATKDQYFASSTTEAESFLTQLLDTFSASTTIAATTTTNLTEESVKDTSTFEFDGVFYKKNDLPVEFRKIFTPTGGIYVKIASDEVTRTRGLSGVSSMDADVGMLFIFPKSTVLQFWMKDMNFPLDIVWIDENKKIIDISEDILPESYPNTVSSIVPARYVLEMNAQIARKIGLKRGVAITF